MIHWIISLILVLTGIAIVYFKKKALPLEKAILILFTMLPFILLVTVQGNTTKLLIASYVVVGIGELCLFFGNRHEYKGHEQEQDPFK